ncbi:MAG: hypothetical protein QM535_00035 [Limnohabitans sp.]|nr:hypothetical protein [Limnohabitans sp.]
MLEIITQILNNEVTILGAVLLMVASLFLALFQTIVVQGLIEVNLHKYFFFILNPLLVGLSWLINKGGPLLIMVLIFITTIICFIVGIIRSAYTSSIEKNKDQERFYAYYGINKKTIPFWKKALASLLFFSIFPLMGLLGPYMFLVIIGFIVLAFFLPSNKNNFLKYQSILPTSKIHSVATGLAEVKGKLISKERLVSPLRDKPCIGFYYKIQEVKKDDDGKDSYTTIFSEQICKNFFIQDETGKIEVNPEKMELIWLDEDESYYIGNKLHTQYLLKENDEMLIIGKVGFNATSPIIEYENIKKVFGIAPVGKVENYNTNLPLRNAFFRFTLLFIIAMVTILLLPIRLEENKIVLDKIEYIKPNEFINYISNQLK